MVRRRLLDAALFAVLLVAACGGEEQSGPAPGIARDARLLRDVVNTDVSAGVLRDVDRALADLRTERAAQLLTEGGIGAAERQLTRVSGVSVTSPEGEQLKADGERVYRERIRALTQYRDALVEHGDESLEYLDAIRRYRRAEEDLLAFSRSLGDALGEAPAEP